MTAKKSRPGGRPQPKAPKPPTPQEVSVAEVLLAGLARADPGPEATPLQERRYAGHKTLTRALMDFWGPKRVSEIDAHQALEYCAWRTAKVRLLKHGTPAVAGPVSARTLNNQLQHLRTQLNASRRSATATGRRFNSARWTTTTPSSSRPLRGLTSSG